MVETVVGFGRSISVDLKTSKRIFESNFSSSNELILFIVIDVQQRYFLDQTRFYRRFCERDVDRIDLNRKLSLESMNEINKVCSIFFLPVTNNEQGRKKRKPSLLETKLSRRSVCSSNSRCESRIEPNIFHFSTIDFRFRAKRSKIDRTFSDD